MLLISLISKQNLTFSFSNSSYIFFYMHTAYCKSHLKSLQIPYIRASNKIDYTCLFLATWLDVLAVLCACVTLARTMSTSLDAMTGGMAHILILGRRTGCKLSHAYSNSIRNYIMFTFWWHCAELFSFKFP